MNVNLIVVLVLGLAHLTWADEVRIIKDDGDAARQKGFVEASELKPKDGASKSDSGEKAEILRQFFEFEGISADIDESTLAHYKPEVVEKMADMLKKKDDFVAVYKLNSEVNSLIYELIEQQSSKEQDRTSRLLRELETLQLMVPNSEAQPTFQLAKEDLRKFCIEQPKHCDELLERVKQRLERKEFHTLDAVVFLEGFYYNWVPLGRLSKYIEDFGQASE